MARIFISYKRVDKVKVFQIKDMIESSLGEKCWIDLDGIESDAQYEGVIVNAINESKIVLFMYSRQHSKIINFDKDWTIRELNYAESKNKRIVFVNIDASTLTDRFAFRYGTKQQVDATSTEAMSHLINDLDRWLSVNTKGKSYISQSTLDSTKSHSPTSSKFPKKISEVFSNTKKIFSRKEEWMDPFDSNLVHVEGASFTMGCSDNSNSTPHEVEISSFSILNTPVTQSQWREVMGSDSPAYYKGEDKPVESVSFKDIKLFIEKLNERSGQLYRLPYEAEWEFAARGGILSNGYQFSGGNNSSDVAWCECNETQSVAQKKPNELGIYDMSGNVQEWCQDRFCYYSLEKQTNPRGGTIGDERIVRGGNWCNDDSIASVTYRFKQKEAYSSRSLGFRLVRKEPFVVNNENQLRIALSRNIDYIAIKGEAADKILYEYVAQKKKIGIFGYTSSDKLVSTILTASKLAILGISHPVGLLVLAGEAIAFTIKPDDIKKTIDSTYGLGDFLENYEIVNVTKIGTINLIAGDYPKEDSGIISKLKK